MKHLFQKITALLMAIFMLAGMAGLLTAAYAEEPDGPLSVIWEGTGSSEAPYQVSSAEHLAAISTTSMSAHYIQTMDIDLSGYDNWTPIGGSSDAFTGVYDGGGYAISGLKITGGPKYSGLFYWLGSNGKLKNIGLEGAQVTASAEQTSYAGSLVSWNDGTITACYTRNPSVRITQSFSFAGGLVGCNNGTISDSYSLGGSVSTSAYTHLGGLIGQNQPNKTVRNCYSTTAVTSSDGNRGGLIGYGGSAPTSCYYDKEAAGVEGGNGTPKTTADMKKLSTFSGWDFADTWKLHEDGSYPRLQWEAGWTEGEEINAAWFVLNWNLIRGSNSDQNYVTADLNLPAEGKQGASISWTASPEGYVDTNTGEVTIPSFDEGDQDIMLTATVSKGSETPRSKQFAIKIKAYSADTDIEKDFDALTWDSIKGGNSSQDNITTDLAALPTAGDSGTSISWAAEPAGQNWISIPSGTVNRPTIVQGQQSITLTATVSKSPGTSKVKAFVLTVVPPSVSWSGNGSEGSPYQVSSAAHLYSVRHLQGQNVYFKQTTDIDLMGMEYNDSWLPIGTYDTPFVGHYDGDGHKISNLRISRPADNQVGLFGFISGGGSVKNLHLTDAVVTGGVNVGILAGIIADGREPHVGGGTLEKCSAGGTVSGEARVGGLVGAVQQNGAVVKECLSTAAVAANPGNSDQKGAAGGLVGFVFAGLVQDSYSAGNVTGGNRTGGFVGDIQGGAVNRCYADGSVAGTFPKGFVGDKPGGTVSGCYFSSGTGLSDPNATGKSVAELKHRSTFAAWDFENIWKIGEDVSSPTLQWQRWTADEEITVAKYAVTWENIKGSNSSIGDVISDLSLSSAGEKGVAITWSVPSEQSWLTASGAIVRPDFTLGDKTVILTASFNKAGGAEQSKEFSLTIKRLDTPNAGEAVTLDHAALTWDVIKKDNAAQNAVTGELLLPTAGENGSDISWTASPEGTIDVSTGAVTLPAYDEEALEITLTATVSKIGTASSLVRSFTLTVRPAAAGEQQAVDATFDWLTWDIIKRDNDLESNVKTDLNLTQTGLYGSTISWSNNWGARIDPATGAVTRPGWMQEDAVVTNKAVITKGDVTKEKQFILTVKAQEPTDSDSVNKIAADLTWNAIKGGNDSQSDVTVDLAALPTVGEHDVTIEWTAEPAGQSWLSIPSGDVARPSPGDGNKTIILKASIKKGSAERTQIFTLEIKASPFAKGNGTAQHPYQVGSVAELELVRSFLGAGNQNVYFLQTADIPLSGNWTPIGDTSNPFYGKYNGGGYRISGLRVDGSYNNAGLFGYTWGPAMLENIRLTGVYIRSNTSNIQSLGALCGINRGTVKNCSAEGEVHAVYGTVQARAGVLIGYNAGTVERCFSAGSVSISGQSSTHAGGLAGRNEGTIRECYSRASAYAGGVSGSSGGLVGNNNSGGVVQRSYSTGHVTGDGADHTEGGLVGYQAGGSISDSFYNRETSGKSDTGKGTPKTTLEMKQQAAFPTWDFTADTGVWRMMETFTYPLLQWQPLTADEIIVLDTAALNWDIIKGENDAENNVMTDLSLPSSGPNGASITWEVSPTGYIGNSDGKVTRPHDEDKIVTLTARINRSGGTEQTKAFTLTVKLDPIPPTIDGPTTLTLIEGYAAASTGAYTVTGTAPVTVAKTSGSANITWNDSAKKLEIAAGLAPGSYPVTMEASNGTLPDATLTFILTVNALVNAQAPVITNNLTDKTTAVDVAVTLDATATVTDGGTISYAWYSNTSRSSAGATALGVTTAAYSPAVSALGTTYYYCVVTNTNPSVNGATTATSTSAFAEVRVIDPASMVYTVTFDANSGSVSPAAMQTETDGKLTSLPTPLRSDHRFDGWFTAASGGTAVTVDTVFTANTTVFAHWTYIGGGSSAGGSGGSVGTSPEPPPNQPATVVVPVTAAAGANGAANASVPHQDITDAIARAQAQAANGITMALNITMPQGAVSVTTTLTQGSLNSLVNAGVSQLELNGAPVSFSFDLNALQQILRQSGGNINFSITPATGLSAESRALIGSRPVYSITISTLQGGQTTTITSLGSGTATLSIPYTPGGNEAVGHLFGVYVDSSGNPIRIDGSAYDANAGAILISTSHFSVYGVGYTAPSAKFTDISTHWARESIDYVVGRGLFGGTTETSFAPNTALTRGMLVTVLGRLAGVDEKLYTAGSFSDVVSGKYYLPYVEWAYQKGIISGIGDGRFAPERAVTREEIAFIFTNYAKATGCSLPAIREAATFADDSGIGSAYKDAVKAMQQAGIMTGGSGNKFNPKAGATRAEVAVILHRYIRLSID